MTARAKPEACRGKIRYQTRADAKKARRRIYSARLPGRDGPLSAYLCDVCDYFHLGHLPQVVRRGEVSRDDYTGVRHVRD